VGGRAVRPTTRFEPAEPTGIVVPGLPAAALAGTRRVETVAGIEVPSAGETVAGSLAAGKKSVGGIRWVDRRAAVPTPVASAGPGHPY
jgi:hypothetical protein